MPGTPGSICRTCSSAAGRESVGLFWRPKSFQERLHELSKIDDLTGAHAVEHIVNAFVAPIVRSEARKEDQMEKKGVTMCPVQHTAMRAHAPMRR